jgi:hypothetical protein
VGSPTGYSDVSKTDATKPVGCPTPTATSQIRAQIEAKACTGSQTVVPRRLTNAAHDKMDRVRSTPIASPLAHAGAVALIVSIVACASGCGVCGNADIKEYPSPDRATKVVVFTRDCGVTTDVSTQASVVPASASVSNASGNAFVADTRHGRATGAAGPELGVRWVDARTVELSYQTGPQVFKAETSVGGIKIVYRTWR